MRGIQKTGIIFFLVMVTGLTSCRKFLEEKSQTDMTPKSTEDYSELLFGDGYPLGSTLLQPQVQFMDDDVACYNSPLLANNQQAVFGNMPAFTWQPDFLEAVGRNNSPDVAAFNSWSAYYKLILGCNVALQAVDGSIGNEVAKRYLKGQALGLRAYYYFMLVNLYGRPYNDSTTTPDKSLGVPLRLDANLYETYPARNTVAEVYRRISQDIDSACILLDADKINKTPYRFNYIAAHFLASRVALFMEQWDKAAAQASIVMQYHPALMDLPSIQLEEGQFILNTVTTENIWLFGSTEERKSLGVNAAYAFSASLGKTYQPGDLRSFAYYMELPDFLKPVFGMDYVQRKFDPNVENIRGMAWRSAEMYLNRAEANIQLYKTTGKATAAQQALTDLNTLRQHRFAPWVYQPLQMATAEVMLQWCRDERRREFFNEEGHRWFDLRRYGMPAMTHVFKPSMSTVAVYQLKAKDPQYVLAIPGVVLQRNPSLVQNPQSTGVRLPE
ncbi:MAG: RagB/SusD family nutrient uptake outer membrane protein [Chitinophaga sp.]|uniref:RagB/SusD family nutrient uptake outer membrane protein n=1 Tax=Chitinophaga sp. TaxID=1869181 RepID=UPI001B10288F|nr:RagB/SusD family nutrient uptake outer membrane protein [Chitinophaga sp.]MBO9730637.1 RagB/SusD family nutrient uptake outer membrane protein [Chitinophaga sp.]